MGKEYAIGSAMAINELDQGKYQTMIKNKSSVSSSGCWLWQDLADRDGYARIQSRELGKNQKLAHRVAYAAFTGPIPAGIVVRHTCDATLCVNPAHLLLGTIADNVQDRVDRKRSRGGRNGGPPRKLSTEDLRSLRLLRDLGYTKARLASMFSVSQKTIYRNLIEIAEGVI